MAIEFIRVIRRIIPGENPGIGRQGIGGYGSRRNHSPDGGQP